jgi:hypothetical protein
MLLPVGWLVCTHTTEAAEAAAVWAAAKATPTATANAQIALPFIAILLD